ncbi:MAG: hypothetical protein D3917_17180 [Candidatus Electrothrix sp. AX5]|nr:hypothetical protein [Candidatus Electrothrix sp. AX5]
MADHALMSYFLVVGVVIALMTVSTAKIMGAVCLYLAMASLAARSWGRWWWSLFDGYRCRFCFRGWKRNYLVFFFTASEKLKQEKKGK